MFIKEVTLIMRSISPKCEKASIEKLLLPILFVKAIRRNQDGNFFKKQINKFIEAITLKYKELDPCYVNFCEGSEFP